MRIVWKVNRVNFYPMLKQAIYKRVILIGLILGASITASTAQEMDYEEIINSLATLSPQGRYALLFEYQKQDPHFSNTYIQIADACENLMKDVDPLRNVNKALYWANNAKLYYGLFPVYLKSNEVRRNREYYSNFSIETEDSKLENEHVIAYINQRVEYCTHFIDSLQLIYSTLEKSKDHYNNCISIFNGINTDYDNLNEALLKTDEELLSTIEKLKNEFELSIKTFEEYKGLINEFPIASYDQTYTLALINTFRLEGLTNSDFLKSSFKLWDYASWVNEFKSLYTEDIVPLRKEIEQTHKIFNDNKRRLSIIESIDEDVSLKSFSESFIYRLGKYDNNSIIRDFFTYLNTRQDFLVLNKSPLNLPTDTALSVINTKLRYYHRLTKKKIETSDKLKELTNAISEERVERHKAFFETHYQGYAGFKQFAANEAPFLNLTLNSSYAQLNSLLSSIPTIEKSLGFAQGKGKVKVALYPNEDEETTNGYTSQKVTLKQGKPNYVSGYVKKNKKNIAFITKISDDNSIEWINEIGSKYNPNSISGNTAPILSGFESGAATVVSSEIDSVNTNTLVVLNSQGNLLLAKPLPFTQKPLLMHYDEINKLATLAFGAKENSTDSVYQATILCQIDSVGEIKWQERLNIRGKIVDLIKQNDTYIAVFNYTSYLIKQYKSNNTQNGAMLVNLNQEGSIANVSPIHSSEAFSINRVFPISTDEINLIGKKESQDNQHNELCYILVSPNGDLIYSNLKP